jgi:hypothetical protein
MQDVAISQKAYWRVVERVPYTAPNTNNYIALNASSIRLAAYALSPTTASALPMYHFPQGAVDVIPLWDKYNAQQVQYVAYDTHPGVFRAPLYAIDTDEDTVWYECIMDGDISSVVQDLQADFLRSLQVRNGR